MVTLDLDAGLYEWLAARAERQRRTVGEVAADAIATAKAMDDAGREQRNRAIHLTAEDLRALADS